MLDEEEEEEEEGTTLLSRGVGERGASSFLLPGSIVSSLPLFVCAAATDDTTAARCFFFGLFGGALIACTCDFFVGKFIGLPALSAASS